MTSGCRDRGQHDRLGAGAGLANDSEVGLGVEHAAQPLPDDGMVVDEQHVGITRHLHRQRSCRRRGR